MAVEGRLSTSWCTCVEIVCVLLQLQSRALTFAVSMEKSLVNNINIFSWLTKELKKVCLCVCVCVRVCLSV